MNDKVKPTIGSPEEDARRQAYNAGMEAGKRFAAYYILERIERAHFNQATERARLTKNAYFVHLDELVKSLSKTFGTGCFK